MKSEGPPLTALIAQCSGASSKEYLDALIRRLQPLVAGVATRTLLRHGRNDPEMVRDLCQETFIKLLGGQFNLRARAAGRSDGQIVSLIKTTTTNLVLDALRALKPDVSFDEVLMRDDYNEKMETAVLIREVDATLQSLLPPPTAKRDYRIFWFYHRHRMSAREIALLPGIGLSVKGVESVIFRLTADVKAAIGKRKGIHAKESL